MHGYNVAPVPTDFNPRSPCGERLCAACHNAEHPEFQSTLPVWGATVYAQLMELLNKISIHAPRVGSDGHPAKKTTCLWLFQSTLPVWGATHMVDD